MDEYHAVASRAAIFYFSEPLKPATTYNAIIFLKDTTASWNFTTTAEPYYPRYEAMPSALGISVAATISAAITLVVAAIVWKKKQGQT